MSEYDRLARTSDWYKSEQLEIDRAVLAYRFQVLRPYLFGDSCLELGPAEGAMTRLLISRFEDLTIVDGALDLLNLIPDDNRVTKVHSLFENFRPRRRFDTVVMDHVLEHVENPDSLLKAVRGWLQPNGRLLVGVPNALSIHRLVGVKMGLIDSPYELNERDLRLGHRRIYDMSRLKLQVDEAGFKVLESGGVLLKPLAYHQLAVVWTPPMLHAFLRLGQEMPDSAAELYVICALRIDANDESHISSQTSGLLPKT